MALKEQIMGKIEAITESPPARPAEPGRKGYGVFFPLCLFAVALAGWFSFQTVQLVNERSILRQALANQEAQVQQSARLRTALDGLAADTARLAEGGNANAKLLVDELRKRNITINPNAAPAK